MNSVEKRCGQPATMPLGSMNGGLYRQTLIKEVLSHDSFSKYGVLLHFSVRNLIRDFYKLDEQEQKYASNPLTHLDFLIYNKLGKIPILAIEVDGYAYHKEGTRQAEKDKMKDRILEKYNLPLLRFVTNGSNEKQKLMSKLNEIQRNIKKTGCVQSDNIR